MKRSTITLADVAEWKTLNWAAYRAAQGKRDRRQVDQFFDRFQSRLRELQEGILHGTVPVGDTTQFQVFDPKPRQIHAPVFRERVLHHALMRHMGPVLDRSLIHDSFACRLGKGAVAAVRRVQHHCRRFPWYAKIDIRQYFPSIDHGVMFGLIERQFKDEGLLHLVYRIIHAHEATPGTGLPIGALTSQHFANLYLNGLDRRLLENPMVRGIVRYMDDTVFWCETKGEAKAMVAEARYYVESRLKLRLRSDVQLNRSAGGVTVCGYRVLPGSIRLTRRRRRRYAAGRDRWERQYCEGKVSARQLQSGYAAVLGSVLHADSAAWRREQLRRRPVLEACDEA